jgi:hypothetical protein
MPLFRGRDSPKQRRVSASAPHTHPLFSAGRRLDPPLPLHLPAAAGPRGLGRLARRGRPGARPGPAPRRRPGPCCGGRSGRRAAIGRRRPAGAGGAGGVPVAGGRVRGAGRRLGPPAICIRPASDQHPTRDRPEIDRRQRRCGPPALARGEAPVASDDSRCGVYLLFDQCLTSI